MKICRRFIMKHIPLTRTRYVITMSKRPALREKMAFGILLFQENI